MFIAFWATRDVTRLSGFTCTDSEKGQVDETGNEGTGAATGSATSFVDGVPTSFTDRI